jgi:hypothetical protein
MPVKHFVIDPSKRFLSKEDIQSIEQRQNEVMVEWDGERNESSEKLLSQEDNLKHVEGRVVVKVDMMAKNHTKFESGLVIRRERQFNEFNRRITQPTNCIVISAENIEKNAEILVEHNALHETNRINDYKNKFESEETDRIRYYSISTFECLAWRKDSEWKPVEGFEFGLRIFKPYEGIMLGVEPTQIKDTLWVTSGEYKGHAVRTLVGCDYQIIFNESFGIESNLIVFRPEGDEKRGLESEAIALMNDITEKVKSGEYLVGYTIKDAKPLVPDN